MKESVSKGEISLPFIWKASRMGYDGYGVNKISNNKDLEKGLVFIAKILDNYDSYFVNKNKKNAQKKREILQARASPGSADSFSYDSADAVELVVR